MIVESTDTSFSHAQINEFERLILVGNIEEASNLSRKIILNDIFDAETLYMIGTKLWHSGKSYQSKDFFSKSFDMGYRNKQFIRDYIGLLTGEMDYKKLFEVSGVLRNSSSASDDYVAMLVGHAALAGKHSRDETIEYTIEREKSKYWFSTDQSIELVQQSILEKNPMSLIRLGDGEARFMLYCEERMSDNPIIDNDSLDLIVNCVWNNWFGENIPTENFSIVNLYKAYYKSVCSANIIGVTDSVRIRNDTSHFGYLAYQEQKLAKKLPKDAIFCNALIHYGLNDRSKFLSCFLSKLQLFSVISPHASLASRLAKFYGIKNYASYLIPGERRLPSDFFKDNEDAHFPTVYENLIKNITVRERGEVFLVAAGLLGKVYCGVIKDRGGIAIDVGSIVDGWMGINTRPGFFDSSTPLPEISS